MSLKSRKRRSGKSTAGSSATSMLAAMFTWSKKSISVRDLADQQTVKLPTIVRIASSSSEFPSTKLNFPNGTLYLVRAIHSHQLVVARTTDGKYVIFPRDGPLRFHLISNNNTLCSTTLTLADILGGSENGDDGPCNGQSVQLSKEMIIPDDVSKVIRGRLELTDIYTEKYLLTHAFVGATLNRELKVLPGYLSLKVDVPRGMTSGSSSTDDLSDYIGQLTSVTTSFQIDYDTSSRQEIVLFSEPPNNHYEWIEPPRPSQPTTTAGTPPRSISFPDYVKTPSPASTAATLPPQGYGRRGTGGRRSLDDIKKRPLPPIPASDYASPRKEGTDRRKLDRQEERDAGEDSPYEDFDDILATAGHKQVDRTRSHPTPSWTGSEPNLLDDDDTSSSAGRSTRLSSSQSLENLSPTASVASDSRLSTTQVNGDRRRSYRPPIPAKPSAEFIVDSFRAKRNSMLHRQRPVARTRRSGSYDCGTSLVQNTTGDDIDGETSRQACMTETSSRASGTSVKSGRKTVTAAAGGVEQIGSCAELMARNSGTGSIVDATELAAAAAPSIAKLTLPVAVQLAEEEDLYDRIMSPLYTDMNKRTSGDSVDRFQLSPSRTEALERESQYETPPEEHEYDELPPARRKSIPKDFYANFTETTSRAVSTLNNRSEMSRTSEVDKQRSVTATNTGLQTSPTKSDNPIEADEDEDGYCTPMFRQSKAVERGQGVGAEKEDHSQDAAGNQSTTRPGTGVSEFGSDDKTRQTTSLVEINWSSLDEIPKDVTSLSVEGVIDCLCLLNLQKYVDAFHEQQIDGELLASLDKDVLVQEFGFKRFEAIKLEKFLRDGWRPKYKQS